MGEDLFRASQGGRRGSFRFILSWRIKLNVPETVTVILAASNGNGYHGETKLPHRWQEVVPKLDDDLFLRAVILAASDENGTTRYPNTTGLDFLRHAMPSIKPTYFKVKSDFVWVPIPESGLLGLWKLFLEDTTYPFLYGSVVRQRKRGLVRKITQDFKVELSSEQRRGGAPGGSGGIPGGALRGYQPLQHPRQEGHHHAQGHLGRSSDHG
ncbi:hypothetical protein CRG98_029561 [Punica granatum]|uniref:Uncharacterized protein n=1 Tax=Punica granatum TaxID=22663 RepID=A0A2I0J1F5_PUNGR|nr:hypothetical protein CRG98_029561 [Punica granatum]